METKQHWETVYSTKAPDAVSWYAPHLRESLDYIQRTGLSVTASILDVGGGESTLVDDLLDAGYEDVCVLDISEHALDVCRERLGKRASSVRWVVADALQFDFPAQSIDIWHDRAVFHFLTDAVQRKAYVRQVLHALKPGGYAIVGTFGPEGPTQCSGLPVARYDAEGLHGQFGEGFRRIDSGVSVHTTPWGTPQQFVYCLCKLDR